MQAPPRTAGTTSVTHLAKLRGRALPDLLPRLLLSGPAIACLSDITDPVLALQSLENGGHHADAVRLIAHALPRREAVWWACMCARHSAPGTLAAADRQALEAAEAWVFRSEDAARRAAFVHAQEASFATPEAWAAVAAFWSGDSMAPVGQANVPPAPHLTGTAVAGSAVLASVREKPERRAARLIRFIESGRDIASGGSGRLPPETP